MKKLLLITLSIFSFQCIKSTDLMDMFANEPEPMDISDDAEFMLSSEGEKKRIREKNLFNIIKSSEAPSSSPVPVFSNNSPVPQYSDEEIAKKWFSENKIHKFRKKHKMMLLFYLFSSFYDKKIELINDSFSNIDRLRPEDKIGKERKELKDFMDYLKRIKMAWLEARSFIKNKEQIIEAFKLINESLNKKD